MGVKTSDFTYSEKQCVLSTLQDKNSPTSKEKTADIYEIFISVT
jgi:hypothetical protein